VTRLVGRDPDTGRFTRLPQPKALTAAVMTIPTGALDRWTPRGGEPWQKQAWALWRVVGALKYPTSLKAKQVARVKWDVTVGDRELDAEQSAEAIAAVTYPLGPTEAARRIALNFGVAGEAIYYRRNDEWSVAASVAPSLRDLLDGADIVVRSWIPDPVEPSKPDAVVRGALDVFEEIRVLQALSRSQSRNRVAQRGIILRPMEGEFPDGEDFSGLLHKTMIEPIGDEYAASAVVPPDIAYPGELIEKWRHFVIESPYDDKLDVRLDGAIRRAALVLDMPPEVLLGSMEANHWGAWLADEQMYAAHVGPDAVLVGEVFAEAIRRALDDGTKVTVTPDPSELLARRQSVADAFQALTLGVVGFEYVRRQIGADEEDAPTAEDTALILAMMGRLGVSKVDQATPAIGTGQVKTGPPSQNGNGNGSRAVTAAIDDTSDEALDDLSRKLLDIDTRLLSALQGATEMAVDRLRDRIDEDQVGVQIAVSDEVDRLGVFWDRQVRQGRRALTALGIDATGVQWDEAQEHSRLLLVEGVTEFALTTLPRPDSRMLEVPVLLLRRVLAAAGGSGTAVVADANPAPTFQDPQGFSVGILTLKQLKVDSVSLVQWRFRYGPAFRQHPFIEHRHQDGRFATIDGEVNGYAPGDHAGCCAAGTIVSGPLANGSTLRWYEGDLVELLGASGNQLTVTPNHPVLTSEGWVAAGLLREGDHVIRCLDGEGATRLIPDDYQTPSVIEDVVEAVGVPSVVVPVAPEHFHGDGRGSEVCVVRTDRALVDDGESALSQPVPEHQFRGVVPSGRFVGQGTATPGSETVGSPSLGFVGGAGHSLTLLRGPTGSEDVLSLGHGAEVDVEATQPTGHEDSTNAVSLGKSLDGLAGFVEPDELVRVGHRYASGHVYNLQTRSGWYIANGIIVHNCLCFLDPVFRKEGSIPVARLNVEGEE